jgi:hypothetical protein
VKYWYILKFWKPCGMHEARPPSPCINCKWEDVTKHYWHLSHGRNQPLFYTFVKNAYAFKDDDCICRMCEACNINWCRMVTIFFTHFHVLQKAYKFFTTVIIFCISCSMECKITWVKWHITIADICACKFSMVMASAYSIRILN